MPDQVASLLPAGAGRFQNFLWPDLTTSSAAGVSAAHRPRSSGAAAAPGTVIVVGAGVAAASAVINGVPCQQLISGVGAGSQRLFYPGFPVLLRTTKSAIDGTTDDCAVYRIVINMASQGAANAGVNDFGFQLVQNIGAVDSRIVAAGNPGIAIQIQDANVVLFGVNGPHGIQAFAMTAGPFDTTQFHTYDLRLFSATATTDAFLTMRIDGALIALPPASRSWTTPLSDLPPAAIVGANIGFVPSIVSAANAATALFVQSLEMIAAPSELMTL